MELPPELIPVRPATHHLTDTQPYPMPDYRRAIQPGGTYFFTVVTCNRRPILLDPAARQALHAAFRLAEQLVGCVRF